MASISVFLNVHDLAKSRAFYEALGFTVTGSYPDGEEAQYLDLEMDGAELSIGAISASDDADFQEWVSTPLGAGVLVDIEVDDVDEAFDRAVRAGAEVDAKPTDRPYGRTAMVVDPDGYSIILSQP